MPAKLDFQPAAAEFYAQGHWREGDLWADFEVHSRAHPDKVALHDGDRQITYLALEQAAVSLSTRLAERSIGAGDVVILLGRNSIEAVVALLACFHRGVLAAPLPPMFGVPQLSALRAQADARAVVGFGGTREIAKCQGLAEDVDLLVALVPGEFDDLIAEYAPVDRDPSPADAPAVVLHSSGTTSAPKGIVHSSNTLRYAAAGVCDRWELTPDGTHLIVCEFGFVGSLVFGYLPVVLTGATGVVMSRWNAEEALRLLDEHACEYVLFMPTHSADLLAIGSRPARPLKNLRSLLAPGLTRERRQELTDVLGSPALACYGMSEIPGHTGHRATGEPFEKTLSTEGRPFDGTDMRIFGPDGGRLGPGEVGSVVVNGPSRFLGFLGNDRLTAESLTDWGGYATGDLAFIDEDGHFVYQGRSKDIIRRGGVTLVPADIEPVILRHPAIREVALVPVPDERLGERPCAAVILSAGTTVPTLAELQEFLDAEGLSKYSWPESIELFEDFPRTPSLKVVKREVIAQVLGRLDRADRRRIK